MKKKILAVALAACLLAVVAFGSLAYFTATHEAKNIFTASYDPEDPNPPEPSELFSIDVEETKFGGEDGDTTNEGNTYTGVLPGDTFVKDPTIINTGKVDQYVRVMVTFDKVSKWADVKVEDENVTYDKLFDLLTDGYDKEVWDLVAPKEEDVQNDEITYTFYLKDVLPALPDEPEEGEENINRVTLFNQVTVPSSIDVEEMADLCPFSITVKADAIQAQNTGDQGAAYAFENFWG